MDLGRLRSTEWLAGGLSAALLGVMFLDWYGDLSAWEAFAVTDVLMALLAAMALAVFVLTATQPTYAIPVALSSLAAIVSLPTVIAVLVRVFVTPDDLARGIGPSLGLALVVLLALSIWFGLRNERPGHGLHARDARERVVAIETLPAPPAAAERP